MPPALCWVLPALYKVWYFMNGFPKVVNLLSGNVRVQSPIAGCIGCYMQNMQCSSECVLCLPGVTATPLRGSVFVSVIGQASNASHNSRTLMMPMSRSSPETASLGMRSVTICTLGSAASKAREPSTAS